MSGEDNCACLGAEPRDAGGGIECVECHALVPRERASDPTFGFNLPCDGAKAAGWTDPDDENDGEDDDAA
jgi:hypothetical protein